MENAMQIFKNNEFGQVRIVEINNEPYFVGKDVADALGYQNASKALDDHIDDEDKLNNESLLSLVSLERRQVRLEAKTPTSHTMLNIGRQNCQISSYGV